MDFSSLMGGFGGGGGASKVAASQASSAPTIYGRDYNATPSLMQWVIIGAIAALAFSGILYLAKSK